MEKLLEIGKFIIENYQAIFAAVIAILTGAIAIAMMFPGDQPEKTLQKIVDFLSKFSRKPAGPEAQ